jgi:magnesium-protoporphyrin O-methyltransferase
LSWSKAVTAASPREANPLHERLIPRVGPDWIQLRGRSKTENPALPVRYRAGLEVARELYAERGGAARLETRCGDFAELAQPSHADLVTLDRVVCCHPDYAGLLSRAANAAGLALVLSYPRDRCFVRLGSWMENLPRRFRGSAFRTFIHPVPEMHAVLESSGLRMASCRQTPVWSIERWMRA